MDLSKKELVAHPDNLIEGRRYSVLIESGGKLRRVTGKFVNLTTAYDLGSDRPQQALLCVVIERNTDELMIKWKYSRDWRDIT